MLVQGRKTSIFRLDKLSNHSAVSTNSRQTLQFVVLLTRTGNEWTVGRPMKE